MDIERALVSKIIQVGRLEDAISKGVRADFFQDPEARDMWEYITDHSRQYGLTPTMTAVKADRPKFEPEHVSDSIEWVIDKFIVWVKRRVAQEHVLELAALADDPEAGADLDLHFLEVARKMTTLVPSAQISRFSDMDKRITEYEKQKLEKVPRGLPFGPFFPKLDEWTGGLQAHEMMVVMAFSGIGKSTLLQALAFNWWRSGKTPLFISLEMEAGVLLRKFDAMAGGLDYYALKRLKLEDDAMESWRETAVRITERPCDIPVIDSIRNCTPEHIHAETVRHAPDVVIVDYLSLMRSSRPSRNVSQWQSLTEITQDLKQNARTLKVPILAAAQSNRSGAKVGAEMDNIGYSLSISQDSDIMLGLFQDDDMRAEKKMEIRLSKNRDGRLDRFEAVWDFDTMEFRQQRDAETFSRVRHKSDPPPNAPPATNPAVPTDVREGVIAKINDPEANPFLRKKT